MMLPENSFSQSANNTDRWVSRPAVSTVSHRRTLIRHISSLLPSPYCKTLAAVASGAAPVILMIILMVGFFIGIFEGLDQLAASDSSLWRVQQ